MDGLAGKGTPKDDGLVVIIMILLIVRQWPHFARSTVYNATDRLPFSAL